MYLSFLPPRSSCHAYKVREYNMQWGYVTVGRRQTYTAQIGVGARRKLGAQRLDVALSCRNENRRVVWRILVINRNV